MFKSANSSHHIRRVFPSVHCSTSVMPCAIWYHLFNLENVISLTQPTQYMLVLSIFTEIVLFFLAYLKFCSKISGTLIHYIKQHDNFLKLSFDCFITCNIFNITSCINMDSFFLGFRNILDSAFVVANQLNIWLPYCGFPFPSLTWLIFQVQYYFLQY